MLSLQENTNHPGNHRRQNSTPQLSNLNQPTLLPSDHASHDLHRRGTSINQAYASTLDPQFVWQNHPDRKNDIGQQHGQNYMQETQQNTARPGPDRQILTDQQQHLQHIIRNLSEPDLDKTFFSQQNDFPATIDGQEQTMLQEDSSINSVFRLLDSFNAAGSAGDAGLFPEAYSFMGKSESETNVMPGAFHRSSQQQNNEPDESITAPITPTKIAKPKYIPTTPETAPFPDHASVNQTLHSRSVASSPTRKFAPATIITSRPMRRGQSCQDGSRALLQSTEDDDALSPLKSASSQRRSTDLSAIGNGSFLNMSELNMEIPSSHGGYDFVHQSPVTNNLSPTLSSFQSSPEVTQTSLFQDAEVDQAVLRAKMSYLQASQDTMMVCNQPSVYEDYHPAGKSQSEIDVEECVRDTGITIEEIASFIHGPLPEDSKWQCLYEDVPGRPCGKRFARKENAKSHVQTHLGDRQFVCKVCETPFVRQHDLKRHFKIHTTEKPHKCPCGKDFHRHDALTRHRQRGMCVGAFEGSPKKPIKRGRPKKQRPHPEDRLEKAAKTRQHVMEKTRPGSTYASSISGSSEYSHDSPPNFDNFSVGTSSPSISHQALQGDFSLTTPFMQHYTPPTSPSYSAVNSFSSPTPQHAHLPQTASRSPSPQITSIVEEPEAGKQSHGSTNLDSTADVWYSTPPELELSSSSPATSTFFDFIGCSDTTSPDPMSSMKVQRPPGSQIFNEDFPLFEAATKFNMSGGNVESMNDFFNFADLENNNSNNAGSDDQANKNHHTGSQVVLGHSAFDHGFAHPADIFNGL